MRACLTPLEFDRFDAGQLDAAASKRFTAHLSACDQCRTAYEQYHHDASLLDKIRGGPNQTTSILGARVPDSAPAAKVARRLPHIEGYQILGVLGQGGMGIVYRAVQTKLNRTVALKVLPAIVGSANPAAVTRFRREATAAARLHHTNIVPIYDFGESSDAHYYAMELIVGQPLDVVIQRLAAQNAPTASAVQLAELLRASTAEVMELPGTTERSEIERRSAGSSGSAGTGTSTAGRGLAYYRHVAKWIADAADALHYAHAQSIIHRDIKPSNLIVTVDHRIMIADFGLAKGAGEESLTLTGSLLGSLRYMSPEQAMAKRVRVDHRTDIYSLGATLYELLTFQPAFPGNDDKEILGAIISRNPTPARKLIPTVPRELETICIKTLEKSPDARYDTARALAEDLRRYVADLPITARRPGSVVRATKWVRRHKGPAIAVCTGVLLIAAVVMLLESKGAVREKDAELAERVAQSEVERVDGLYKSGIRDTDAGNWSAASASFEKAIAIDNRNVDVLLAFARMKKEQFNATGRKHFAFLDQADAMYREALDIDPDNANGLNLHGVVLKLLGQLDEAEDAFQQVVKLTPDSYAGWVNLGNVRALKHDLDAARRHLEKSTELASTDDRYAVDTFRNLASLKLHLGDAAGAERDIANALTCNRNDVGSLLIQARLLLQSDEHLALQSAGSADHQAERLDEKAKRLLALASLRTDAMAQAITHAEAALAMGDLATINHLIIAIANAKLEQYAEARTHQQAAIDNWPEDFDNADAYRASADSGVLWFDTAAELNELRAEAEKLLRATSTPP